MGCQVIFFQGIPGLGKTTVAFSLKGILEARGKTVEEIDQDRFKGNRKKFAKALWILFDKDYDYIIIHRNSANAKQYAWIAKECFARGFLTTMFYPSVLYDPEKKDAILATCQAAVKTRGPHPTFDLLDDTKKDVIVRKFYGLCEKPLAGGYFSYIHPIFYFYPDVVSGKVVRRPPFAIAIQMVGCLEKEEDLVPYPLLRFTLTTVKTYICIKLVEAQKKTLCAISDEYLPLSPIIKLYTDHITLIHIEDLVKAFDRDDGSYQKMKAIWDFYGAMEGDTATFKVSAIYTDKEDVLVFGVKLPLEVASRVPHITGRLYNRIPPVASASLIRDGTWKGRHYDLKKIPLDLGEWEGTIGFQ